MEITPPPPNHLQYMHNISAVPPFPYAFTDGTISTPTPADMPAERRLRVPLTIRPPFCLAFSSRLRCRALILMPRARRSEAQAGAVRRAWCPAVRCGDAECSGGAFAYDAA